MSPKKGTPPCISSASQLYLARYLRATDQRCRFESDVLSLNFHRGSLQLRRSLKLVVKDRYANWDRDESRLPSWSKPMHTTRTPLTRLTSPIWLSTFGTSFQLSCRTLFERPNPHRPRSPISSTDVVRCRGPVQPVSHRITSRLANSLAFCIPIVTILSTLQGSVSSSNS